MKVSPFRRMNAVTLLLRVLLALSLFSAIPLLVSCSGGGTPPTAAELAAGSGSGSGGGGGGGGGGSVVPASIIFSSQNPASGSININGVGQTSTITVTFQLLTASNNPVSGTLVDFTIQDANSGASLQNSTGTTASDGTVSTILIAGTQAGTIQVQAALDTNPTKVYGSTDITIIDGPPNGPAFLLNPTPVNINGLMNGVTVSQSIIASVSDFAGNPVPNGTKVRFASDYAAVTPSLTFDGTSSSVTGTITNGSSQPLDDGIVHVQAQTTGGSLSKVLSLAVDPLDEEIVYAGTDGGGVFKTTDGGLTWIHVGTPLLKSNDSATSKANLTGTIVRQLVIDPNASENGTSSTVIYAATDQGVFISKDRGVKWSTLTGTHHVRETLGKGSFAYGIDGWSTNFFTFNYSFSNVRSRMDVYINGATIPTTAYDLDHPTDVFDDQTPATGFLLNKDAGDITGNNTTVEAEYDAESPLSVGGTAKWQIHAVAVNPDISDFDINLGHAKTIWAGSYGRGVWKSTNGGNIWTQASTLANTHQVIGQDVKCLAVNSAAPNQIFAGTDGDGLYKSDDGGASWVQLTGTTNVNMYNETVVNGIVLEPASPVQKIWIIGGKGLSYSTDGGATWKAPATKPAPDNTDPTNSNLTAIARDAVDGTTLYVASYGDVLNRTAPHGGVYKSMDSGVTWSKVTDLAQINGANAIGSLAVFGKSGNDLLYAGCDGRSIFKSQDSGNSWAAVNGTSPSALTNDLFATTKTLFTDVPQIGIARLGTDVRGGGDFGGTILNGETAKFYIRVSDRLGNPLVAGTAIKVSTSCGASDTYTSTLGDFLEGGPGIFQYPVTDFYVRWTNNTTSKTDQSCCIDVNVTGTPYTLLDHKECFNIQGAP